MSLYVLVAAGLLRGGATSPLPPEQAVASLTPAPGAIPTSPPMTVPSEPVPSAPAALPSVLWPSPPEPAPLGLTPSPSQVPGDSTDAQLDPRAFAPPADLGRHVPTVNDLDRLQARSLILPVQGFDLKALRDNFAEKRGGRVHEAIDFPATRGTPVLAVDDGEVKKLFTSGAGGFTVYQYDPSGTYCYYYAHLDRYADGLAEGKTLRKGDVVGYVGTSGNAPPGTPHLHFTIFKLGSDKRWWEGTPINPYPLWALR